MCLSQCSSTSPAANVTISAVMSGVWCLWHEIILGFLVNDFIYLAGSARRLYQIHIILNSKSTLSTSFPCPPHQKKKKIMSLVNQDPISFLG